MRESCGEHRGRAARCLAGVNIDTIPMADGGEGTAEVICDACGGEWEPAMRTMRAGGITARYVWIENRKVAVMEMSEAGGCAPSESARDPVRARTYGVGEMMCGGSESRGADILPRLGGSATNDGGFGWRERLVFALTGREF